MITAVFGARRRTIFHLLLLAGVLALHMFNQLILSIVLDATVSASIGLVVCVSSLMITTVSYRGESLRAETTLVGLLSSVCAHMH
jgi:hypothetical protein